MNPPYASGNFDPALHLPGLILMAVPILFLLWVAITYNTLVRLKQLIRESWAALDTELQRRHDLIPNLVEVVKGYAGHERSVLEAVTEARGRAMAGGETDPESENRLARATRTMLGLVEAYPELKADRQFLLLQNELINTEDRIQASRRFFNANVRDLNTRIEVFPSNMVAGIFGFQRASYWELESAVERENVRVQL
jgi:LemA protein